MYYKSLSLQELQNDPTSFCFSSEVILKDMIMKIGTEYLQAILSSVQNQILQFK